MSEFDIAAHISHIEANRSIKEVLMQSLKARRPPYRITVTDLLNLKQAYFKRKYPEIVPPLEKQELMWRGAGFHKTFGFAVSSEEYLEQFVEAEGIAGKIDIFEKMPVEVKTTATPLDRKDLLQSRPTYIEQLGMYCAMVNVHEGEIIIYQRTPERQPSPSLVVYHITFPDLEAVRREMRRRRDILMEALISNDPSNLPLCPWFSGQCDYSEVCDCKTTSLQPSYEIARLAGEIYLDERSCQKLLKRMVLPTPRPTFSINDVVFPRKAYCKRLQPEETAPDEEEREEYLRSLGERGFLEALRDALHYSVPGEVQRIPVQSASLTDLVQVWQGMPVVLRDPKFPSLVGRERLPRTFPHYFLRLGFECALTNRPQGRLVVYYPNVPREEAKLMVYDVAFTKLSAIASEVAQRLELLQKATTVLQLPRCPSWMCPSCDYRIECGQG